MHRCSSVGSRPIPIPRCRLDQLVVEKSEGAVAFEWRPISRRCRRLMLHGGLGKRAAILSSLRQVSKHRRLAAMVGAWGEMKTANQDCRFDASQGVPCSGDPVRTPTPNLAPVASLLLS